MTPFASSVSGDVTVPVGAGLVKAELFNALQSVDDIISQGRAAVAQTLAQAERDAEALRAQAFVRGQQDGVNQYAEKLLELDAAMADIERRAEKKIVSHVFAVLRELIPSLPADHVTQSQVLAMLRHVQAGRSIEVRVHPLRASAATKQIAVWKQQVPSVARFEIKSDAALAEDECEVVSEFGTLKASVNQQLTALEAAIQQQLRSKEAA